MTSPNRDRRLTRLEQRAQTQTGPTFAEVHAAAARLRSHAVAMLRARLQGEAPPGRDEAQAQADQVMVERWCHTCGTYEDPEGARARLQATLKTIAARHAAAPPGVSLPPLHYCHASAAP